MKAEDVAQYLRENPQFFDQYAEMLADIRIPHPYDGRAISISERQMTALREKNRQLQVKLHELINNGEHNDIISEKMHRLMVALMAFNSLEDMLHGLNDNLCEIFAIPHVALRLWFSHNSSGGGQRSEFKPISESLRAIVENMAKPYCGPNPAGDIIQWFGRDAQQLQSFCMIPLRRKHTIGLLVMGSPESERFHPDMGTLYLERLGELIAGALARFKNL